ncbi:hypothetical protein QUF80_02480 [Desulfococcaceae bacterium HSG8]|nr:hypothetical protein [Desulfococcaceae bacterium HSG8]
MQKNETKVGILLLTDIVNYTPQSVQAGTEAAGKFLKEFHQKISEIADPKGVEVIGTSMGDCALMFLPFDKMDLFIDFVRELREKSVLGFFDGFGIKAALRFVAHFGNFELRMLEKWMISMNSPDAIKPFRMEKSAGRYDVLITNYIKNLIGTEKFSEKGIGLISSGENHLKGFEADELKTEIFKLVFPDKTGAEQETHSGLEQKTAKLEQDCQLIYVLGDLYDPIPMEKNFINLEIRSNLLKTGFHRKESLGIRDRYDPDFEEKMFRRKESQSPIFKASDLYDKYPRGIIFGLPGAGKTTILRYFAHREFKANHEIKSANPQAEPRVILFVNCREILSYREWYCKNPAYQKCEVQYDINSLLEYLTHSFLFRRELPTRIKRKRLETLQYAVKQVVQSYSTSCLTVLIDALDEAANRKIKDGIEEVVRTLYQDIKRSKRKGCRLYLSSRYSEKDAYFHKTDIPVFEVCSLKMEHLREMAGWFYGDDTDIYRLFDDVVWKEEIAAKIGGTPLTALLVLAYFQVFRRFDTRYAMYDILMKFMLMRIWQSLKDNTFKFNNIESFFNKAKSPEILSDYPEISRIYDAVTLLSWFYVPRSRSMKEEDILSVFKPFTSGTTEQDAIGKPEKWMKRLKEDHLFIWAGHDEYVFIHSTFMEFLASRFIAEKRNHPDSLNEIEQIILKPALEEKKTDFFKTETIPICSGSSLDTGFYLLRFLKETYGEEKEDERKNVLSVAAFKSLAELENLIQSKEGDTYLPVMKKKIRSEVEAEKDSFEWIYTMMKELILHSDQDKLQTYLETFNNISRLSRHVFLESYLDYDTLTDTDSSLLELRKKFLFQTVKENLLNDWLSRMENRQIKEKLRSAGMDERVFKKWGFLRIDTATYHPDDKNFQYYQRHIGKELIGFFGSPNLRHSSEVNSVAMSSDGKYIISGSFDKTVRLWDLSTGKEIRTFTGHQDSVNSVSLSEYGRTLVSGSDDNTVRLWNLSTGKELRTFTGHQDSVRSVSLSEDGTTLISGSNDKTVRLWDVSTGKEIRTFTGHQNFVNSVSLSEDGTTLISGSGDKTVRLWDVSTGKEIRTFTGHQMAVSSVSLSEDSTTLVSGSDDNTVRLWDASTGKKIRTFTGHQDSVNSVSLSEDGTTLVSGWGDPLFGTDNTVRLWDVSTGKKIRTFTGHQGSVNSVNLSEDGTTLVSGSSDNTVRLWDVSTGKEIRTSTGHQGSIRSVSLSEDGTTLVSGSGDLFFGTDNTVRLWDVSTGKEIRTFTGHRGSVNSVSLSEDGTTLVSGSFDNTVRLWDVSTGKEIRTFTRHQDSVRSVSLSEDGKTLVSGSDDNTVRLWDVSTGKEIRTFTGHQNSVSSVSLSEDGTTLVSGSGDNTVRLWDVSTGKEIRTFTGHQYPVQSVSLSEDGTTLVSGSDDNTVRLWDVSTGKEIRTFTGHQNSVASVSLSEDGRTLVSGSLDNTVRLWDVSTGKCIKTITLLWIPFDVKFFKNNPKRFVVAGGNGTVALFDLDNNYKDDV